MARTSNPLIGATSGSVGNITLYTSGGQYLMRTKPLEVGNPRTPAQVAQRARFAKLVQVGRQMSALLAEGFAKRPQKRSGFNQFVSVNSDAFNDPADPEAGFDPAKFAVSAGNLHTPPLDGTPANVGAVLTVDWTTGLGLNGQATDKVTIVAISQVTSLVVGMDDDFIRSAGTADITLSPYTAGDEVIVALYAYNPATREPSDSALTEITLA